MSFNARFVCGESVAGPSHIAKDIPNQDSFLIERKRKYTLLVVSDGMGSKKFAQVGSHAVCIAVQREIECFSKNKKASLSQEQLLQNIVKCWENLVKPHSPKDCSATCLFVFATKRKILTARLGDGMICLLGKKSGNDVLLCDNKEETFSNVTHSISETEAASKFCVNVYEKSDFCAAVLTSDGISADLEDGREIPFARDVFDELLNLRFYRRRRFLQNMMKNWPVPHHTDDKTIAVVGF